MAEGDEDAALNKSPSIRSTTSPNIYDISHKLPTKRELEPITRLYRGDRAICVAGINWSKPKINPQTYIQFERGSCWGNHIQIEDNSRGANRENHQIECRQKKNG